jgi:hypothetical protein
LERLEVRATLGGDRHDLAVQYERRGELRSVSETGPNNLVNEWPFLERRRTEPSWTVAITRKPSHFGS